MNRPPPLLERHLLTRSDLASMQVPAIDVFRWLTEGCLEQVGELPTEQGRGEPVFTVFPDELRLELSEKLAAIGKTTVVLTPLGVRSFLLRAILTERGLAVPDAVVDAAAGGVPADATLPEELMMGDLSEVLQNAAREVVDDVEAILELAAAVAASEAMTRSHAHVDHEPAAVVSAHDDGDDEAGHEDLGEAEAKGEAEAEHDAADEAGGEHAEAEACFDFDDPTLKLGAPDADAAAFAAHDADERPTFAELPDEQTSVVDAASVERERDPEAAEEEPEAELLRHDDEHDASDVDADEAPSPDSEQADDAEQADDDEHASHDTGDAARPDPFQDSEQPTGEPIADAATRDPAVEVDHAVTPNGETLDGDTLDGGDELEAAVASDVGGDADSPLSVGTEAEPSFGTTVADAAGESIKLEAEDCESPDEILPTVEERTEPEPGAPEPPIEALATDPPATNAEAAHPAAAAPEAGPADKADEAGLAEPIAASDGEAVSATMANNAMDRVETFLAELKHALIELAQRPQPQPIDVEPIVHTLQAGFERSAEQATQTTAALTALSRNVGKFGDQVFRDQVEQVVSRNVQAALAPPAQNQSPVGAETETARASVSVRPDRPTLVLAAVAVLAVCWSVLFWIKTGSLRLAVGTLVGANLIGCCLLLARRDRS